MKLPLTLLISTAVAASVIVVYIVSLNAQQARVTSMQQEQLSALVQNVAARLEPAQGDRDIDGEVARKELALQLSHRQVTAAFVFDLRKNLITSSVKQNNLASDSFAVTLPAGIQVADGLMYAVANIGKEPYLTGKVVMVSDMNGLLAQSQKTLFFSVSPWLAGTIFLTVIVALLVSRRLLRPLQALIEFTRDIARDKDYSKRFSDKHNHEVARLGTSINSFLDTIEVELIINKEQNDTLVEQQQTMMRLANYDSLTGLPNRQFVVDNLRLELARVRRTKDDLALVFFDLDGFKGINDSLGHETGDLILIEVADRVVNLLREGDLIARLGGDEFIIVPDRDVSDASLKNLADKLVSAFTEPFMLRGLALTVGVSVGIARASDAEYELSQLMSNADLAMYRSKAKGRGTYTLFTIDMVESYKRKMSIANSIDGAIRQDEFLVYYQPKISQQGEIIGLEALIRWQHPEFGLVMPSEFIPIAEQGGKISAITQWMIERVCMELPDLQMLISRKFKVAINLSGHDLRHTGLFDDIYGLFERYQVNPEYFEFEVTESAYLENFAFADKFFKRLSNLGCAISLDDFGTGYSSLSYLTQITIDTLKVDRQFIRELDTSERSRLVTGTIIDLAKRLALTVCAEGIEHPGQWAYLIEHGCDHVQGYLFSKPVPLSKLLTIDQNYLHLLNAPDAAQG